MRLPTTTTRSLMVGVAVVGVLSFAAFRLDIPSLPLQTIWRGEETHLFHWGQRFLLDPRLAFWIIPALSLALVWPSRNNRVTRFGLYVTCTIVISWGLLRRPFPCFSGGACWAVWPDLHITYIKRSIASRTFELLPYPPPFFLLPLSGHQKADLTCIFLFMVMLCWSLVRSLPRRTVAFVALLANSYSFIEWVSLMCAERLWAFRTMPLPGHSAVSLQRASWAEVVQGLGIVFMIWYLFSIVCSARRTLSPTDQPGQCKSCTE